MSPSRKTINNMEIDWKKVSETVLTSRAIDDLEESVLVPGKKVLYQFSARGHDMIQAILGQLLTHKHDGISAYYRSRPLMLSLGLSVEDAFASSMAKSGGYTDGRDIGVISNMPGGEDGPTVLPLAGDVGSQYTPGTGWAQGIEYRRKELKERRYNKAIAVITGGDGSVAANGFWSSLTIATTLELPVLFVIEDNGYGISVSADLQTPGGNIAENLASFKNLKIIDGNGSDPVESSELLKEAVEFVRDRKGPALIRLTVPRLSGHSGQDNQAYKGKDKIDSEKKKDPLLNLKSFVVGQYLSEDDWNALEETTRKSVAEAAETAWKREAPDAKNVTRFMFADDEIQKKGGLYAENHEFPESSDTPDPDKKRITMVEGIRKTLQHELQTNSKVLIFGEDVGQKGGVHAVTMDLQSEFGNNRVFDTSLSEEGIIGRATGMAFTGLMPVAEIQFRKYADPATEHLNNCGSLRWRTANKFAAPMVVRMPGGFAKCGDPWHSVSNEVFFTHATGWQFAFPSNVQDAVGLLRSSMRSNNPTIFFEHRNLLDAKFARRPYPGDDYVLPFGKAAKLTEGEDLTIVSWGAMLERCIEAADQADVSADILDLRTLAPWDKQAVLDSVKKTNRCLIVHEDGLTSGFGAEISAVLAKEAFQWLDAPVERIASPNLPIPYNVGLMNAMIPGVEKVTDTIAQMMKY